MSKVVEFFKSLGISEESLKDLTTFDPLAGDNATTILNAFAKNPQISHTHTSAANFGNTKKVNAKLTQLLETIGNADLLQKSAAAKTIDENLSLFDEAFQYQKNAATATSGDFEKQKNEAIAAATLQSKRQLSDFQKEVESLKGKYHNAIFSSKITPIVEKYLNAALDGDPQKAIEQKAKRASVILKEISDAVNTTIDDKENVLFLDKATNGIAMNGITPFNIDEFVKEKALSYGWHNLHQQAQQGAGYYPPPNASATQSGDISEFFKPKNFNY